MTAPLEITVTNAGRAAIVNAQNTGTAPVTITQIGLSGTAVTPLPTATALAGEFKRVASIAGEVVANDTIHVTLTDSSGDAYTLRSIGLYLADGTLFAIYGQAGPVLEKTAQSIAALSVDVIFADIAAASLTFGNANFTNPPATTERQGVVELATLAEAQAGIDALRALTPSMAKAAILGWLLAQDGAGCGLDADLLDGQDGSYYTNIIGRLGFSPVNKAGDTMTGLLALSGAPTANLHAASKAYVDGLVTAAALLAKLLTVDGAGSGIDADLLDGQQGSYYVAVSAYTAADVLAKLLTVDGPGSGVNADLLDGQQGSYYLAASAYTAADLKTKLLGVDGSGSGVDADLLDGQQGSYYLPASAYTAADVLAKLLTVDGIGSGVNADLLDGQQGAYYTDIRARIGADGSAPIFAARAWANFNGTGTVAIRDSGNVSSVTDLGVGRYRVNFATAMPDANYAAVGNCTQIMTGIGDPRRAALPLIRDVTATNFVINTMGVQDADVWLDAEQVMIQVAR